ncbi:MAG TPA: hypothetical protein VGJ91_04415, partial [Polyangiaceae bacterium]
MILAAPHIERLLARLWLGGGMPGRIALIGVAALLLGSLLWLLIRRALRKGGRNLLRWFTAISFVLVVGLGVWVKRLPEARGSS